MCFWALWNRISERDIEKSLERSIVGEQLAEGARAALDFGGILGGEQGMDHRDHAGAASDQGWRVVQGHAADGDDRQAEAGAGLLEQFGGGGRRTGLGLR